MNIYSLDINKFFLPLKDEIYCIIKLRDFPRYTRGSDIDIFCYDLDRIAQSILRSGRQYIFSGYEIQMHRLHQGNQVHLDLVFDGKIEFRFDLYACLPRYKNVRIKDSYFESVIENRVPREISCDEGSYHIFVPCETDDMIIRYVEYTEWFSQVPDKIGHVEYILSRPGIGIGRVPFIDKLHHYIELPECPYNEEASRALKRHGKARIDRHMFRNLPQRVYLSLRKRIGQILHLISSHQ